LSIRISAVSSMMRMRSVSGDGGREDVEDGGLAGAGPAGDQEVLPGGDRPDEDLRRLGGDGPPLQEVLHREVLGREAADGEGDAVEGDGLEDGRDAAPVVEAGVQDRLGLGDVVGEVAGDRLGRGEELGLGQPGVDRDELACTLDEHAAVAVDHDLGDGVVEEVGPDRLQEGQDQVPGGPLDGCGLGHG
jgi:hypothetical protein